MTNADAAPIEIAEEDGLRADMYDFIASLLRTEPSDELIAKSRFCRAINRRLAALVSLWRTLLKHLITV